MGPFGRAAVGLMVSKDGSSKKDVSKKKDVVGKEGNKSRKGGGEEDGNVCTSKKESVPERRRSGRLFSWSKDDTPVKGGTEKTSEKGRRISAPGKVQNPTTAAADAKMESSSFLSNEFGLALGLNRIKTRSGPLYTSSTCSGPVFAGTVESRFGLVNVKREDDMCEQSSSKGTFSSRSSSGVRKALKAAKVHARDSVSPKDSTKDTDCGNSKGRRSLETDSGHSRSGTTGSYRSPLISVSKLGTEESLRQSRSIVEDAVAPIRNIGKEAFSDQVSPAESASSWLDVDSNFDIGSGEDHSFGGSPVVYTHVRSLPAQRTLSKQEAQGHSRVEGEAGNLTSDVAMQESEGSVSQSEVPKEKEIESPRFQALLRMTGGPRKGKTPDIKSFSHELDPRGIRSHEFMRPHNLHELEEVMAALGARFHTAKEEVNAELEVFGGDLVEILEKGEIEPWNKERIEDLLVLARECVYMDPQEFRKQCEAIVQDLDDRRQELRMGNLKKLHTRMLFILTRCTRLLQFEKENGLDEDGLHRLHQQAKVGSSLENWTSMARWKDKGKALLKSVKPRRPGSSAKFHALDTVPRPPLHRVKDEATASGSSSFSETTEEVAENLKAPCSTQGPIGSLSPVRSLVADRLASWKNSSGKEKSGYESAGRSQDPNQNDSDSRNKLQKSTSVDLDKVDGRSSTSQASVGAQHVPSSKRHQRVSWGHWRDQPEVLDDNLDVICRICEDEVATSRLEDHSRVCAMADRCDQQGLGVDERLHRLAETLERMAESLTPKSYTMATGGSPETAKTTSSNHGGDSSDGGLSERGGSGSEKLALFDKVGGELLRRGSEEMLEDLHEIDTASMGDEIRGFNAITCKTRFGPKVESFAGPPSSSAGSVAAPASSTGSLTPRSPLATPRISQIDLLLSDRIGFAEADDPMQVNELADIARCIANANPPEKGPNYLVSCLQDLQDVLHNNKIEAFAVDTFGKRIGKLCREKYHQFVEVLDETASSGADEELMEDDAFQSHKSTPVHPSYKDRTTIDDFEIIKPISRGAFGRVCLARKRATGDLFAIKVLRKADMIRKNAVESVRAERNILISARNPFVVRFFYSFTCRENLYLVMEYLNGGDMYSMLRNLGCLEEKMARVYVAELVLALEYLHSLGVVHRDLKPDNILIAHDGHIKLTDFGLSRVGLINSTDDLSGPAAAAATVCMEDAANSPTKSSQQRERRPQRSAVGTPDYLAPEILLGTSHGPAADWWSTGVILFELLTGMPPFNAGHPQIIFDNILNRHIPWPAVPEDMSCEAQDLIDRLLTEDPNERLGAKGAAEVKGHPFFKDINWDTLARQKAAFIPSPDSAHDTSYFASRFVWNSHEGRFISDPPFGESSDDESTSSGSTSDSDARPEEARDTCGDLAEFDCTSVKDSTYSFSNFSFKNLSQLASINYDLLQQTERKDSPKGPTDVR